MDISWDGVDSYRIPEWNPKYRAMEAKFTYVTKEHVDHIPGHLEALSLAIENGTAQRMKVDAFVCPTCGHEHVTKVRRVDDVRN